MTMSEAISPAVESDRTDLRLEVRALLARLVEDGRFEPRVDTWVTGWDEDFSRLLGSAGYLGVTIPTEYGGRGLTYLDRFAVTEELLAAGAPIAAHWIADRQIAPALLAHGTEEQKRKYLPRIAAGECYFAIGMSEPEAGSDLAAVKTRAHRVDGGWTISGSKVWTSGAHRAEAFFVLARSEALADSGRHGGLTQFIVELDRPGVEVRPIRSSSGDHHFNEVFLTDVFVRDEDVLGEVGAGWTQVTRELAFERSGPERFLSTFPLFASMFASVDLESTEKACGRMIAVYSGLHQLSHQVSQLLQEGIPAGTAAAQVKLLGGRFEGDVVGLVDDLTGAEELIDAGTARLLSDALMQRPGFTLRGGTTEILGDIIARGLTTQGPRLASALQVDVELSSMVSGVMKDSAANIDQDDSPQSLNAVWSTLSELGLTRLTGDPAHGGSGAGWEEAAALLETAAAKNVGLPLAEHDLLAGWVIDQTNLEAPDGATSFALVDDDGVVRCGVPTSGADHILVVRTSPVGETVVGFARPEHIERPAGFALRGSVRLDAGDLSWRAVHDLDLAELRLRGALARAIQITGALGWIVDSAIDHTNERRQFGQPLAKFQAVRGLLATISSDTTLATAAVTAAVRAAGDGDLAADVGRRALVAVAKSCAGHASESVIRHGHQLHGAIGTTLEHRLHRYSTSVLRWRNDFGSASYWDRQISRECAAMRSHSVWEFIVGNG